MVFDWLFPKRCVGCQKEGSYLCFNCQKQLQLVESFVCPGCNQPAIAGHTHPACQRQTGLSGLTTIFKYNFLARRLIHKLKYRLVPEAARVLTQKTLNGLDHQPIFSYFLDQIKQRQPVLVPVPLHWSRFNWRGFNQAEKLAEVLAKKWALSVSVDLLERKKLTWSQAKLSKQDRLNNVLNAFRIKRNSDLKEKNILLIDDVWTTGTTLNQCAAVLKQAGAKWVWGLTLAR